MTTEQNALLDLVKIGVTGDCLFGEAVLKADWKELFVLACKQGVTGIAWNGIETLYQHDIKSNCPLEIKLAWYAHSKQVEATNKKMFAKIAAFAEEMKPLQIAVLKGADYAQYWDNPLWRESGDLDCIAVDSSFRFLNSGSKQIDEKAVELGYKVEDGGYKHSHIHFTNLMVENHHSFTDFAGAKESEELERELRKFFCVSGYKIKDTGLLSPNNNFTALFMVNHAQSHFFYEGITLRHILDWYYFLAKEGGNVDWLVVKPVLEKNGLMPFAVLVTQISNRYLGSNFNMDSSCNDELMEKFIEDMYAEKVSESDRRLSAIVPRILNRFKRMYRFRDLMRLPLYKAVWVTFAYSSFLHRKPKLK